MDPPGLPAPSQVYDEGPPGLGRQPCTLDTFPLPAELACPCASTSDSHADFAARVKLSSVSVAEGISVSSEAFQNRFWGSFIHLPDDTFAAPNSNSGVHESKTVAVW